MPYPNYKFRTLNKVNLAKLYSTIRKNLNKFQYSSWLDWKFLSTGKSIQEHYEAIPKDASTEELLCGTSCCLGGWCTILKHQEEGQLHGFLLNSFEPGGYYYSDIGAEWLGIDKWVAKWLFLGKAGFGFPELQSCINDQDGLDRLTALYTYAHAHRTWDANNPIELTRRNLQSWLKQVSKTQRLVKHS